MELAVLTLRGDRQSRNARIGQLMAVNEMLKSSEAAIRRGAVSGLVPHEVQWLGEDVFRIVCLVGEDASGSPLLVRQAEWFGHVDHRIDLVVADPFRPIPGHRASCRVPATAYRPQGSESAPILMHHARARVACTMIATTMEALDRGDTTRAFVEFWRRYCRLHAGRRDLIPVHVVDETACTRELWMDRLRSWSTWAGLSAAPPITPVVVAAPVDDGAADASDCESVGADSILSMASSVVASPSDGASLNVEDTERLWTTWLKLHPVWGGGQSPQEIRCEGLRMDDWTPDLFAKEPWRVHPRPTTRCAVDMR